jgi:hypothetical protein
MTNNSSVEDDEAFIAAILALEAQIRSPEGAAFVVERFSELLATKQSRPDPRNTLLQPLLLLDSANLYLLNSKLSLTSITQRTHSSWKSS